MSQDQPTPVAHPHDVQDTPAGAWRGTTPTTPEQFDAHIGAEIAKFRKIVQDANIRVE